ncbi:hypothetical protein J4405_00075 [Candidatus Woesearchaeota archaeon]|nr:hypothetical protein [Candidatus Woesearchaeota archaeon]
MITKNEKKVLRMLFAELGKDNSINQIAKACNLAPNGAFKILRKFEKEGILEAKNIANIKSYKLNFNNEKTRNILELSLIPEINGRIKFRLDDLKPLKELTISCIIFGSYIDPKKEPNDLDILFILDKNKFTSFKTKSSQIYQIIPLKIHEVLQTKEDFEKNIAINNIITEIIKTGIILWGYKEIIELVKNEYKR